MKKYIIVISTIVFLTLLLSVVVIDINREKNIYQSDTVHVVRKGNETVITDVLDGREYKYRTIRVKRSETAENGSYTSVDTDHLKIEVFPHAIIRIYDKDENKVIEVRR